MASYLLVEVFMRVPIALKMLQASLQLCYSIEPCVRVMVDDKYRIRY